MARNVQQAGKTSSHEPYLSSPHTLLAKVSFSSRLPVREVYIQPHESLRSKKYVPPARKLADSTPSGSDSDDDDDDVDDSASSHDAASFDNDHLMDFSIGKLSSSRQKKLQSCYDNLTRSVRVPSPHGPFNYSLPNYSQDGSIASSTNNGPPLGFFSTDATLDEGIKKRYKPADRVDSVLSPLPHYLDASKSQEPRLSASQLPRPMGSRNTSPSTSAGPRSPVLPCRMVQRKLSPPTSIGHGIKTSKLRQPGFAASTAITAADNSAPPDIMKAPRKEAHVEQARRSKRSITLSKIGGFFHKSPKGCDTPTLRYRLERNLSTGLHEKCSISAAIDPSSTPKLISDPLTKPISEESSKSKTIMSLACKLADVSRLTKDPSRKERLFTHAEALSDSLKNAREASLMAATAVAAAERAAISSVITHKFLDMVVKRALRAADWV